jgi:glycosyltransferase involved in cell wall biosynthesis
VKKLSSICPTIIHIHTPAAAISLLPSLLKLKQQGIKTVYTARGGFDEGGKPVRKLIWHFADPLKWRIWDGVCVVNEHLLKIAQRNSNRVSAKISLGAAIPNWEPTNQTESAERGLSEAVPLRLVWVGRLTEDKRLEDFIQLVNSLDVLLATGCVGEIIGASLDGDGKMPDQITAKTMIYHGWVDSPSNVVSHCDLLISTSVREGYGLAPIEAALVGTPTVAVANHGTRESVRLVGGRLVARNRPDQLLEVIREFAETPNDSKVANRIRVQKLAYSLVNNSSTRDEMDRFYFDVIAI